ncbi:glycosyltransferase [Flavobacteriaceae bacterium]|nr:glycosyltransferase [Flavobacteriaceae bacterium]
MIKVSIIIPLYNSEAYIAQTIDSCLAQTHDNIEIIVVENGSTDQSYQIVKSIDDKRLSVFQILKRNAAAARNYGYHKATGAYIVFLDADDVMASNKIELQLKALSKKPEGWVACCAWAKFTTNTKEAVISPQKVWAIQNPIDWCLQSWMGGGMMALSGWLMPKAVIEKAGLWDERLSLHDDGEFMCRVLLASQGNVFVENTAVYYRQQGNSLSRQHKSKKAAESALLVYKSYQQQILKFQDSKLTRRALARNFSRFVYEYYPAHAQLIKEAYREINELGVKPPLVGSPSFKLIQRIVGFKLAIGLTSIKRNLIH